MCLGGSSFSVDHAAKMEGDLSGMRMPTWSGGALISVGSNSTASPQILSFDGLGRQLPPFILAIPEAETIDIDDAARGADGTLVVCGSAYDHSGHGSGFLAIVGPGRDSVNVVRLLPYYASRVTVASDGTIWTAGVEVTHGKDSTPPNSGVIRHFDRAGKMLGAFLPRSGFSSPFVVQYGLLRSARGRIGWYTGPAAGPGSRYFEILSDGTVRQYPPVDLTQGERVTGLGLTDDGLTYVATSESKSGRRRLLSSGAPDQSWVVQSLPGDLGRVSLFYGAEGNRLVFNTDLLDRFTLTFVIASR